MVYYGLDLKSLRSTFLKPNYSCSTNYSKQIGLSIDSYFIYRSVGSHLKQLIKIFIYQMML